MSGDKPESGIYDRFQQTKRLRVSDGAIVYFASGHHTGGFNFAKAVL